MQTALFCITNGPDSFMADRYLLLQAYRLSHSTVRLSLLAMYWIFKMLKYIKKGPHADLKINFWVINITFFAENINYFNWFCSYMYFL